MNLTILGSQGAIPKLNQFSSSHVLQVGNKNILIDCCEGVQFQLRRNKIKLSNIEIILISHAHGDHFFGLMGLLTTLSLLKRDKKLEIFCPVSVLRIVQAHIKHAKMKFSYDIYYITNFSFFLDLLILFQTIKLIFNLKGYKPH